MSSNYSIRYFVKLLRKEWSLKLLWWIPSLWCYIEPCKLHGWDCGLEVIWFRWEHNGTYPQNWGIFTQTCFFVGLAMPNNLPSRSVSVFCLFPISSLPFPWVRCNSLTPAPSFFLHGKVMRSRCEIKMLWLSLWHMMTGLGRSVKDLCTDEISSGQHQTAICGN